MNFSSCRMPNGPICTSGITHVSPACGPRAPDAWLAKNASMCALGQPHAQADHAVLCESLVWQACTTDALLTWPPP